MLPLLGSGLLLLGSRKRRKKDLSKPQEELVAEVDAIESNLGDSSRVSQKKASLQLMRVRLMWQPQGASVMERVGKGGKPNALEQNEVTNATLTPKEDSVVDTIQVDVDVIDPGVLVVGEMKENGSGKLVGGVNENGDGIEKDIRL